MIRSELYSMFKSDRDMLLLQSTHYNLYYYITIKHKDVYTKLLRNTELSNKYSPELWSVVTNVARAIKYKAKFLQIPKTKAAYAHTPQKLSYTRMCAVLDALVNKGYFNFYKGGLVSMSQEDKIVSIYEVTAKMFELWKGVDVSSVIDHYPMVVIKDRATQEEKSTKGVRGVREVANRVNIFNKALLKTNISLDGRSLPAQRYVRIYNDTLEKGGRMYNVCGGVQTISSALRKRILIGGEKTVELDFKAMHPSILYDYKWQQDPCEVENWWKDGYNPYNISLDFINVDYEKLQFIKQDNPMYDPIRNLVKKALLIGINATDLTSAYLALACDVYSDIKLWEKSPFESKYYGIIVERGRDGGSRFPSKLVCERVQGAHAPILDCFFSDKGIELQNVDSEILSRVLTNIIETNDIFLPEHDSIIVKESIAAYAESLMREAYKDVVGSDRFCQIEKK